MNTNSELHVDLCVFSVMDTRGDRRLAVFLLAENLVMAGECYRYDPHRPVVSLVAHLYWTILIVMAMLL